MLRSGGMALRDLALRLRTTESPLLAHHPLCTSFRDDILRLGKWKFCLGCAVAYPVALATLVSALWLEHGDWSWQELAMAGILLGLVQLASPLGLTRWRPFKLVTKVALGLGLGLATLAVLELPLPFGVRILLLILCIQLTSLLAALRFRTIQGICDSCPYRAQWHCCPGYLGTPRHISEPEELPLPAPADEPFIWTAPDGEELELPAPLL